MGGVRFELDRAGGAQILKNNPRIAQIERSVMTGLLSRIEAQFFMEFGRDGKFVLNERVGDRFGVSIGPADKATHAILKVHPGWIDQFIQNIKI